MKIYVIIKIWQDGKVELIEAYKNEEDAKFAASKHISTRSVNNPPYEYTIAIFTTKLMD